MIALKKSLDLRLDDIPRRGRLRIYFSGVVQGVGFRPFLYRAAKKFELTGSVKNRGAEVVLEVQGRRLKEFMRHVGHTAPPLSHIETLKWGKIPEKTEKAFVILESEGKGEKEQTGHQKNERFAELKGHKNLRPAAAGNSRTARPPSGLS